MSASIEDSTGAAPPVRPGRAGLQALLTWFLIGVTAHAVDASAGRTVIVGGLVLGWALILICASSIAPPVRYEPKSVLVEAGMWLAQSVVSVAAAIAIALAGAIVAVDVNINPYKVSTWNQTFRDSWFLVGLGAAFCLTIASLRIAVRLSQAGVKARRAAAAKVSVTVRRQSERLGRWFEGLLTALTNRWVAAFFCLLGPIASLVIVTAIPWAHSATAAH